jgi:hypothetical protein
MSQQDNAARDTSHAVQLFQDAHQKMVMLKRVDEQMAQLVQRRRTLMDELRSVQSQINDEFDKMFKSGQEIPARLKGLAAHTGAGASRGEHAFADDPAVHDDDHQLNPEDEAVA